MLDSHSVHTNLVHSVAAVVIQVVRWKEVWAILVVEFQARGYKITFLALELVCWKKRQKSPNQETGLGNRVRLKVLNVTKLILND